MEAVTEELQEVARNAHGNPDFRHVIVNGRAYGQNSKLVLGPVGAAHAMEVLHHAAAEHPGAKKMLAKF